MRKMGLKESDTFFHCKANYEATKRSGLYGATVLRGQKGALQGKSLRETCPTHHTKYK